MAKILKNGNPQGSNELQGTFFRAMRLLEYLRKNTDENNPITQAEILRDGGDDHIFGAKDTVRKYIAALADALNIDKFNAPRPEEERRLKFKGSDKYYDNWGDDKNILPSITKIYYNHIFTEDELTAIINALCTSKAVSPADAETITDKLTKNLASTNYEPPLYKLDFSEPTDGLTEEDRARLAENIAFIQTAISEGFQISFKYNRKYRKLLDKKGEIEPFGTETHYISPHYIVSDHGKLFLYGGFKNGKMSVHRVEMISEITFAGKGKNSRIKSLPKNEIEGMPEEMTEEFKILHLNGSYKNDYKWVKFEWSFRDEKTGEFICTALDSTFGHEYKISDKGEVRVRTSLFGMKNFALQYADLVKVIEPPELVKDIAKSVRGLRDKYL